MLQETLNSLFTRDLEQLAKEISDYSNENIIWKKENGINNSAGSLCLHICGNLQHFIGATLAESGYLRDRPAEFTKRVSREELLSEIEDTSQVVNETLKSIPTRSLNLIYPLEVFGNEMTTEFFLIHLHGHLTYHLGQITYHRRLLD